MRDRAILAVLLGCGLRRRELADLDFTHLRSAKNTGPSLIWSAKAATFEPCLCPSGSKRLSTFGWPQRVSQPEDCSDVSVGQANTGVTA
jgi:hypothetical protein